MNKYLGEAQLPRGEMVGTSPALPGRPDGHGLPVVLGKFSTDLAGPVLTRGFDAVAEDLGDGDNVLAVADHSMLRQSAAGRPQFA